MNRKSRPFKPVVRLLFFILSFIMMEVLVKIADQDAALTFMNMIRSILGGAILGTLVFIVTALIPVKVISRGLAIFLLFFNGVLGMIQACCRDKFGTYYQISYMFKMAENTLTSFMRDIVQLFVSHLWMLPFMLGPGILLIIFRKKLVPEKRTHILGVLPVLLVLIIVELVLCWSKSDRQYYTYNFSATNAVSRYGMINTLRLEIEYSIFGMPKEEINIIIEDETEEETTAQPETESTETEESTEAVKEYSYNEMNIDFDSLLANDTDEMYSLMDTYFANQKATKQNEYTGIFEGKNLIMLSAEAFSTICIDEERTPALWRLSQTGFVFNNYYQPDFDQGTTGGEFANMSGLIPMWISGNPAFLYSQYDYMPFALGTIFTDLGYNVSAWHDGAHTYYSRNITHPNMGYTNYHGLYGGLDIDDPWPASDLDMIEATLDDQINEYLENGTPFHTYYMTISGHGGYSWTGNSMAAKNRDVTEGVYGYECLDAYLAANMELEYALEYMLEELEEAGILDDTVIVMGCDHYPYYLTEGQDMDYYAYARGLDDDAPDTERHKNTLILWSGCLEDETIQVDTPCYSCDIVPTLLNLYGIEYDSRMFSGRDIFAPDVEIGEVSSNMHVVCFSNGCWVTAAGIYDSKTGLFHPAEGVEIADEAEYVEKVSELVSQRCTFAKYVVQYDYYSHVFQ